MSCHGGPLPVTGSRARVGARRRLEPENASQPPPPHPLGFACAAALLGGAIACLFAPTLLPAPLRWLVVAIGLVGWWRPWRGRVLGAVLIGFGWTALHAGWSLAAQLPHDWEGREVQVTGRVVELPEHEARRSRFRFRVDGDAAEPLRGRLLQLAWYDDFGSFKPGRRMELRPGAHWEMQLKLRAPRGLSNPGGFDVGRHALAQRIAATGHVRTPRSARELAPAAGIDAWRDVMASRIEVAVPWPSSRFVRALALGDTRGLDDADWEALRAVGLTHLIAISGFHVGMVAVFFAWLAIPLWWCLPGLGRWMPRPQAAALVALLGAAGYAAVAGFALPTVRTLLMIAVVAAARLARRPLGMWHLLSLALLGIVLVDPLAVLQAGFWLSFGGVAWLAWCLPSQGGKRHLLRDFLSAQGVATLGLLPLGVVLFNQASLMGPLANLVAIPWWSLVVVPLALLGTGLEALHAGAGAWAWRAAAWCFDPTWTLFGHLAASRFALWWLPEGRDWALPLAVLGAFWLLLPRGLPGRWLALLLWLPLLHPPRELPAAGGFEVQVLDVGQGLAVVVRTAGHVLLYDAGPATRGGWDAGERAVLPSLRALGVSRLDAVVISHADQDHAGGWEAVRGGMPVARSLAPDRAPLQVDGRCQAGQSWTWDGVRFEVLYPPEHFPYLRNESSCVLQIASAHGTALLPGDIGEVVERRLLREPAQLRADVVVVAHHGSAGSSSARFVAATGARLALIGVGHGNSFGHPREEVVERWREHGAEVLATPGSGAIRVWLDEDGLSVRERRRWRARLWDRRDPPPL